MTTAALLLLLLLAALVEVGDSGPPAYLFTNLPTTQSTTPPPEGPCRLPCSCWPLSRYSRSLRAHCVVVWLSGAATTDPFRLDPRVHEADFTGSRIRTLGHLNGLGNIKVLHMEEVGLVSVTGDAFTAVSQLWSLSLARNHLVGLPGTAISQLPQLHHLSLRSNPITTHPGMPLLTSDSLQVLDLADCRISALDGDTFRMMPALRQLHLEGNGLQEVPANAVAPLTKLLRLFLQANWLLFFPSEAIERLPSLIEVRLDNNTQMQGPLGPLWAPRLQRLSASGCALESLQPNLLVGAPKLRYLEVPGNRLHELWLAGQPDNVSLVLLDASDNPLECDCALRDTHLWAQRHVYEVRISCGSPLKPWDAAGLDDLTCDQTSEAAVGMEGGGTEGGGTGGGGTAAALWVTVSLLVVLGILGAALLFVYRQELLSRYFTPEGQAAAYSGIDVVPLEENRGDEAVSQPPASGMQMGSGIAPWLEQ